MQQLKDRSRGMIDNLNIYEIIGLDDDPIYSKLDKLQVDDEVQIEHHIVRKTDKFYEVENGELHEGFKDKINCYRFLSTLINN